jgi:energy-coupling factor transport system substrate-specific component
MTRPVAIRLRTRTTATITMATFVGVVAFTWPFVVAPGQLGSTYAPPLIFGVLLVLVLAVLLAEIADGGIDSKALAMLGVLSAVNAALRPLGAGTAGVETVFFIIVLAGRVYGAGFGFTLGCTSLFASAIITGGIGPSTFLLNLSFWPFLLDSNSSISYVPGASFTEQWHRYLVFDATTSLGWDTGRAVTNFVLILIVGPAALATFRRAARRAAFEAPISFIDAPARV